MDDQERIRRFREPRRYGKEELFLKAFQHCGVPTRFLKADLERDYPAISSEFKRDESYYICGHVGSGKTTLLAAMTKERYMSRFDPKSAYFTTADDLLHKIKQQFNKPKPKYQEEDDEEEFQEEKDKDISRYAETVDVLALDDLGMERITDWTVGELTRILNNRYNAMKVTYVTSNYNIEQLASNFNQRIASRLFQMCVPLHLDGSDLRLK